MGFCLLTVHVYLRDFPLRQTSLIVGPRTLTATLESETVHLLVKRVQCLISTPEDNALPCTNIS